MECHDKPEIKTIKKCLENFKNYCIQNEILQINMPRICSSLDKINFEIIEKLITEIFNETCIKIIIHELSNEIFINDNESVIV